MAKMQVNKVQAASGVLFNPALEIGKRRRRRERFIAKTLVAVQGVVVALPIAIIVVWAFANSWPWPDLLPQDFTLRGIEQALSGRQNMGLDTLGLSVLIACVVGALSTLIGALAARATTHFVWKGRTIFEFANFLPFLIPTTVFAMGIQVVFLRIGIGRTIGGVILAHTIVALPYAVTLMVEITKAAGTSSEDAARTLGANHWQMLHNVTVPQLLPGILSSFSMCYIISFSQYFLTLLVGGGRVNTFVLVLFPYLTGGDRTIACAYSLVFLAVTFAVFLIFELLLRKLRVEEDRGLYSN